MGGEFVVSYWIDSDEWSRAAAARQNPEAEPLFDYFYGRVQMLVNRRPVLGEHGYEMSVADLACGMAQILRSEIAVVGSHDLATFSQSDDSLEIKFERDAGRVRISSNVPGAPTGETDVHAFLAGAHEFIERFAREASIRVPNALGWKDLAGLRDYTPS